MSLPYFTRGKSVHRRGMPDGLLLLLYPDVVKRLEGVLTKPLSGLPRENQQSIVAGFHFAQGQFVGRKQGDTIWKEVIGAVLELAALVVPLGKGDDLYRLYHRIMEPLGEAQQDLFNADANIKKLKGEDREVLYGAYMAKYLALYEGLVKRTMAFAAYCLDLIADHGDLRKKGPDGYIRDDLSYHRLKVLNGVELGLQNDLGVLLTGVEPHLRNAIAHKRYEYGEDGSVTFRDINKKGDIVFEQTLSLEAFKALVTALEVNFQAQGAALTLFPYEYGEHISERGGAPSARKALKAQVYHVCSAAKLEPTEITLTGGHLTCKLYRESSLDHPSQMFGNVAGFRFGQERPPIPLRDQLVTVAVRLAEAGVPITTADLQAEDHAGEALGRMKFDLAGLAGAMRGGPPFPPFEAFILESDLDDTAGSETQDNSSPEE